MDDMLQHYGVKGMKWGVRRDRKSGQNGNKTKSENRVKARLKEEVGSLRRERSWKKTLKDMDNMSTKELNAISNRVRMENDLKRLSKTKVAKKSDKRDYRTRNKLTDKELMDRVDRLRAKDNLSRNVSDASKEQRELGMRVVRSGMIVGMKYAMTGKVTTKDVGMLVLNPPKNSKELRNQAIGNVLDKTNKTIIDRTKR